MIVDSIFLPPHRSPISNPRILFPSHYSDLHNQVISPYHHIIISLSKHLCHHIIFNPFLFASAVGLFLFVCGHSTEGNGKKMEMVVVISSASYQRILKLATSQNTASS